MTTTPVDEWQQECPHPTLAQDDRLIELIDALGLVVGWQAARVADLEDTVRRLGDEADRLVTERDEARRAVGLAAARTRQSVVDDLIGNYGDHRGPVNLRAVLAIVEPCAGCDAADE